MTNPKIMTKARQRARRFAVQALYQWQVTGDDINHIEMEFLTSDEGKKPFDKEYFHQALHTIFNQTAEITKAFEPFLDREVSKMDQIELAILRLGAYELKFRDDIPFRVTLNETIELAKTFGSEESHKYINGVLDKLAKT